jgi:hypothetical protein
MRPQAGHPRVVLLRQHRAGRALGVVLHGAKLQDLEVDEAQPGLAVDPLAAEELPGAPLAKERRAARLELDRRGDEREQRRGEREPGDCRGHIHAPLDDSHPPVHFGSPS